MSWDKSELTLYALAASWRRPELGALRELAPFTAKAYTKEEAIEAVRAYIEQEIHGARDIVIKAIPVPVE